MLTFINEIVSIIQILYIHITLYSSVQLLTPVQPFATHESQHTRPPCLSPTPGDNSKSCPSSWWCHPAISSSVVPLPFVPQSFTATGFSPMNQIFAWGGQSIGVSALASVLPMNTQDWSPLGWTGWISLQSSSVQFSRSVVCDSLWAHELQHTWSPPTPGVYPNPCPSSRWCHPTISSSVVPCSSCPQSFPASGSFPISQQIGRAHVWTPVTG